MGVAGVLLLHYTKQLNRRFCRGFHLPEQLLLLLLATALTYTRRALAIYNLYIYSTCTCTCHVPCSV